MGTFAPLIITALAAGASAKTQSNTRKEQRIQLEQRAKGEEDSARDRQIERRRRLIRALASQQASAPERGVSIASGSPQAIALDDIRLASLDESTDRAQSRRRILNLRRAGVNATRTGRAEATTTLLQGASQSTQLAPG